MKYKNIAPILAATIILSSGCATMERCNNIPEGIKKDYCLKKVAKRTVSGYPCDSINDPKVQEECYDEAYDNMFKQRGGCTWGDLGTLLIHVGSAAAASL